jgi:hypothetical protein
MMKLKNLLNILLIAAMGYIVTSCAFSQPVAVTNNKSVKEGTVSQSIWLGFIRPMDFDLSVKTAAENGGIKKVATVDFLVEQKLFGLGYVYTTKVTGE